LKNIVILISVAAATCSPAGSETALPHRGGDQQPRGCRRLKIAQARGIPTAVIEHRDYADRDSFDAALAQLIDTFHPDFVILAGFMRILTAGFVTRYHGRLVNIHPSLLPAYGGLHTHARALQDGVRIHGCTVHFVTADLDHGPIIIQAAVPVLCDDTEQTLAARVLHEEHRIYPQAIAGCARI